MSKTAPGFPMGGGWGGGGGVLIIKAELVAVGEACKAILAYSRLNSGTV